MSNATEYHYTESGLNNVWLVNGTKQIEYKGETLHAVKDTEGLHKEIGLYLVNSKKSLSGHDIRFLRKELGKSQQQLADAFGKTDQAIAKWEKEISFPDKGQDILIRLMYLNSIGYNQKVESILSGLI